MEFQVVAAKRVPRIRAGRSLIVFYFRKDTRAVTAGVGDRKTDTGTMKISSAALTALDLVRYPQASGGIDIVAAVLSDFWQEIDPEQLAALSSAVERRYGVAVHGAGLCDEYPAIRYRQDRDEKGYDGVLTEGTVMCMGALAAPDHGREAVKLEEQVLITADDFEPLSSCPLEESWL